MSFSEAIDVSELDGRKKSHNCKAEVTVDRQLLDVEESLKVKQRICFSNELRFEFCTMKNAGIACSSLTQNKE